MFSNPMVCWSCRHTVAPQDHFCPSCHRIQPLEEEINYFQFLSLGDRMNPVPGDLEREFHRLSRLFHPDYYNLRSPEERKFSLERSSFLNGAYRTVRDPVMRARYRLKLEGFNVDEERGKTPPDLLMEVFEINEQLEELSQAENRRDLTQASQLRDKLLGQAVRMKERLRVLDSELAEVFKSWDASLDDGVMPELQRQQLVARMHELLSYRSYIRNLVEDIEEKDREWE